jgi:hypothetical protein
MTPWEHPEVRTCAYVEDECRRFAEAAAAIAAGK